MPGPVNMPVPAFPNVPLAGIAKAAGFQNWLEVFGPEFGSPMMFGRTVAPVLLISPLRVGVAGLPV